MLHYNWKDFIVSAQLICDQILVDAVPANIRKISIESQDIENIEKAFQGEVTPAYLSTIFPEQVKQLRSISIFYQEMCKCFNQAHKDKKEGSILILREWCYDQAALNRKQRMTIKFCIAHESRQIECVVRLKEVYLTPNGLLLKSNTIIFNQLEYYRKAEKKQAKQVKLVEQRITAKVDKQLMGYKELINGLLQEIKKMREQGQKNESIGNSKRSKKASRNEMKIEQMSEQPAKQRRRPHSIGLDYAKLEENMKHEEDQQSKRLKILEDSCPESKVTPFPIQFDQTNPAYHFFSFSNGSVTKIGGFDYPMAILKDTIPFEGTHGAIIKYVIQKKIKRSCCLEIGIIDENNKTLLHSSVSDNYIFFKFNVSTVCTKVKGLEKKKRFGKLRPLVPGEYVEMRVNLSLGIISWASSFGEIVRAQIPQDLRKMKLQPFVGIFTTGDMVEFLDYPQ